MAELTPSSPIGARVLRRVVRQLAGDPMVVGAELGVIGGPEPDRTTQADSPEMRRALRNQRLERALWTSEADASRRRRYTLYEELYRTPEIRQILRHTCAFIFGGDAQKGPLDEPFVIEWSPTVSDDVRAAVDEGVHAMRLRVHVPQQVHEGLLKGDAFGEVVHSLVAVTSLTPHVASRIDVVWDNFNRLKGYRVRPPNNTLAGAGGYVVGPLQMVHYHPHRRWGHRYGESMFYGLPSVGRQYTTAVDVIHVLLALASSNRRTATMEVPAGWTEPQIKQWIKRIRLWNADAAFMDGDGIMQKSIASLLDYAEKVWPYRRGSKPPTFHDEPSAPFDKLVKVAEFDRDRLYLGAGFPKALAGMLSDASGLGGGGALTAADLALARVLRFYQQGAAQLVVEYGARAAVIADVSIQPDDFVVRMPSLGSFNEKLVAETLKLRADSAVALAAAQVPMRWIFTNVLRVADDEVDDLLAEMVRAGANASDLARGATPDAVEAARIREQLSEQVERLEESVGLLKPVIGTLTDPRLAEAIASIRPRTP